MVFDFIELEKDKRGGLYRTLYIKIKRAAECGAIKKGERLPSVREAAAQLGVSRTTVENAYTQLCIEGIAESLPQRGYFITGNKPGNINPVASIKVESNIKYDFSSRSIDVAAADTELWKKKVRSVLWDSGELTSYGEPQGERGLREALSAYSYKARGVVASPDNIVVGAGIGPLLNILCGLTGRDITVGFQNGGFNTAESIFYDYGIKTQILDCDLSGATIESVEKSDINVLFLIPSALSKISVTALAKRRNEYSDWLKNGDRIVIEDDYNGELRYTARSVPAFQGKSPESTVYIGSFSKLLLPSVRIAYMVLPPRLAQVFRARKHCFNQTCGKIEQLALTEYISSGALEKQLKRLRRLYYSKSQLLIKELKENLKIPFEAVLYESSLTIELQTELGFESGAICRVAEEKGLRLMPSSNKGAVRLCFAGIATEKIPDAVKLLTRILLQ